MSAVLLLHVNHRLVHLVDDPLHFGRRDFFAGGFLDLVVAKIDFFFCRLENELAKPRRMVDLVCVGVKVFLLLGHALAVHFRINIEDADQLSN
jgi:hypothetical protein